MRSKSPAERCRSWQLFIAAALTVALAAASGCAPAPDASAEPAAPTWPRPAPRSGYAFQQADTQALQDDPFANPGLLWVDQGAALWADATQGPSCASCHRATDPVRHPLADAAHRYPRFDAQRQRLINLEQQINRCRVDRQGRPAYAWESPPLLALTTYLAHQARGSEVTLAITPETAPFLALGRQYYYERRGQMNLACHHCHERSVGAMLRGDRLSQGLGNGYPTYRLQWQTIGSLQRRLRFCNAGVRAEPFAFGAAEYVNLELYLKWRAQGLTIETPAVRR